MSSIDEEFKIIASLQERVGRPAIVQLLKHYVVSMNDMGVNLAALKQSKDVGMAKALAHRLRGACSSLGFQRLARIYEEMEEAAEYNDSESIPPLIEAAEKENASLEIAIFERFPEAQVEA